MSSNTAFAGLVIECTMLTNFIIGEDDIVIIMMSMMMKKTKVMTSNDDDGLQTLHAAAAGEGTCNQGSTFSLVAGPCCFRSPFPLILIHRNASSDSVGSGGTKSGSNSHRIDNSKQ